MIKLTQLKKQLARDGMIIAGVALIAGAALGWRISSVSGLQEQRDLLLLQSQQEISDAQKEQQQYEETIAAFSHYEQIPARRHPADNLATIQDRIRVVRPIVETLEHEYKFSRLDVRIAKVEDPVPVEQYPNYQVIRSDLNIEFNGLSDELVYAFIQAIIDRMPGYLSIKDLEVKRDQEITSQLLEKVGSSGTPVSLVSGKMTLIWKTLKQAAPATGGGQPQ